ncbi:MAG TPA: hypothetical protein VL094_13955 [Sphingomonadaceae bacterium]|nr:hypothetical protein [Sphingomonadaceae bacterium]
MNSLASTPWPWTFPARAHPAFRDARGLHEKPEWKVTLRLAQSPEKRLETAPDRGGALKTKQGIFLPEKVTHHPAD